jgi:hypothetical protein
MPLERKTVPVATGAALLSNGGILRGGTRDLLISYPDKEVKRAHPARACREPR